MISHNLQEEKLWEKQTSHPKVWRAIYKQHKLNQTVSI